MVAVVDGILERGVELAGTHGLGAYDAIQLASALTVRESDERRDSFIGFDRELTRAAVTEGFRVLPVEPATPTQPPLRSAVQRGARLKEAMSIGDRSLPELWVCHLGTIPYREALAMQEHVRTLRQANELPDTLLLLEHPPVYTRGRRSQDGELTLGEDFYRDRGIDVIDTDRGGRVTYHGPGQLVGYPIMRIDDVHAYLRTIEASIVTALADEGVQAHSRADEGPDYTGVWVDQRKIASIGVHVSRGVTTHGFAVNVANDLAPFSWVVACGLPDVAMTSIANEQPAEFGMTCFRRNMAHRFAQAHGRRQRLISSRQISPLVLA